MSETPIVMVTVKQFKELSTLSHTSVYAMIKSGAIQSVTIGRRRLIVLESWRALVSSRLSADVRHEQALGVGTIVGSDAEAARNPLENIHG